MFTRITVLFFLLVSLVLTSPAFAELNMQDGKWEITSKAEMKGMPAMPPTRFTQCITRKDAVPQKPEKNQDCKILHTQITGDTVTWTMQCKSKEGIMDSNGKITYKGASFEGVMHMTMNGPHSGKMPMTQHMSGKRVGNCK